jgi:Tfp pilus assembly protein PilW
MLTRALHRLRGRLRAEHGFTLAELCMAMAAGVVVLTGLGSIMIATLHQTQRTFTTVDATRQARTAFAKIENELHSACVDGSPPIQGVTTGAVGSDDNNLVFISYIGTSATPTPVWHDLSFNAAAKTLVDTSYNVTGTSPNWAPGTTVLSTNTLLTNAARVGTTPVFQYFAYTNEYTDASGNVYWIIPDGNSAIPVTGVTPAAAALSTSGGLSANDSNNVVEVLINLLVGPTSSTLNRASLTSANDAVSDTISLRLTTPPDYVAPSVSSASFAPCQ